MTSSYMWLQLGINCEKSWLTNFQILWFKICFEIWLKKLSLRYCQQLMEMLGHYKTY